MFLPVKTTETIHHQTKLTRNIQKEIKKKLNKRRLNLSTIHSSFLRLPCSKLNIDMDIPPFADSSLESRFPHR